MRSVPYQQLTLRIEYRQVKTTRSIYCERQQRQDDQDLGYADRTVAQNTSTSSRQLGEDLLILAQSGHDNWVRAIVFHPSGKYLLSGSDDHTIRVWELATGRCVKTVQAHSHFVTCLSWGRQPPSANENGAATNGSSAEPDKIINVVATGSVDQTIKIWLP